MAQKFYPAEKFILANTLGILGLKIISSSTLQTKKKVPLNSALNPFYLFLDHHAN